MSALGPDIVSKIAGVLPGQSALVASRACKAWNKAMRNTVAEYKVYHHMPETISMRIAKRLIAAERWRWALRVAPAEGAERYSAIEIFDRADRRQKAWKRIHFSNDLHHLYLTLQTNRLIGADIAITVLSTKKGEIRIATGWPHTTIRYRHRGVLTALRACGFRCNKPV